MAAAIRFMLLALTLAVTAVSTLPAQQVWRLGGGGNGLAWEDESALNIMGDVDVVPGSIQPWELRPDVNVLPRINEHFEGKWDRWQFPLDPFWEDGFPRLWRGPGNHQFVTVMQPPTTYVDGNRESILWATSFGPGCNKTSSEYYTIDMGAALPLERFELHLPTEFLEDGSANPGCCDRFGKPWNRYVPHAGELTGVSRETTRLIQETLGSDKRLECYDFSYNRLEVLLGVVEQQLTAPVIMDFPLQYLRFARWRSFPDEFRHPPYGPNCCYGFTEAVGYGEMEFYGRGFASQMRIKTQIQDLRQPSTLGRIFVGISKWRREGAGWLETTDAEGNPDRTWETGELVEAPGGDVQVTWRLKNGTTPDPQRYLSYNDQGELIELALGDWEALRERSQEIDPKFIGWRGPVIDNLDDWSAWTGPMDQSGTLLDMASHQYFQLEIQATSTNFWEMARLDSIAIEYFPLLAPRLVGEVGLPEDDRSVIAEVAIGEPTEFVYALSAEFKGQRRDGFDIIRIETPSRPKFLSLRQGDEMNQVELDPDQDVTIDAASMTIQLPDKVTSDQKFQITFKTAVYTVSAQLRGSVFNSDNAEIRQKVEEGNATEAIRTNKLAVIASGDAVKEVIKKLEIEPRVFTPNDDGINDSMRFDFSLFGIIDADVEIAIYTLGGTPIHAIDLIDLNSGKHTNQWNGHTRSGDLVDPGVYLAQVTAQTGRGDFEVIRPFTIAY